MREDEARVQYATLGYPGRPWPDHGGENNVRNRGREGNFKSSVGVAMPSNLLHSQGCLAEGLLVLLSIGDAASQLVEAEAPV